MYPSIQLRHGRESVEHGVGKAADDYKQRGNEAMKRQQYSQAVHLYSQAIDEPVPYTLLISEGPRRAVYHSNRAQAYIARARAEGPQEQDRCCVLQYCVAHWGGYLRHAAVIAPIYRLVQAMQLTF